MRDGLTIRPAYGGDLGRIGWDLFDRGEWCCRCPTRDQARAARDDLRELRAQKGNRP